MNKDKLKKAVALRYAKGEDQAPAVVAKGRGMVAQKIVSLAHEHDIPMVENQQLVTMLEALDVDTNIPEALYQAVAEVLVFVYRLNGK